MFSSVPLTPHTPVHSHVQTHNRHAHSELKCTQIHSDPPLRSHMHTHARPPHAHPHPTCTHSDLTHAHTQQTLVHSQSIYIRHHSYTLTGTRILTLQPRGPVHTPTLTSGHTMGHCALLGRRVRWARCLQHFLPVTGSTHLWTWSRPCGFSTLTQSHFPPDPQVPDRHGLHARVQACAHGRVSAGGPDVPQPCVRQVERPQHGFSQPCTRTRRPVTPCTRVPH